ncbi:YheC/YheD family protein [Cohnella caldifontis]|uniref:YheC/YheD family protein n=1 Tax=Cohnella caldifontis TaxID=3027471 RepID=UPI0023EB52E0|nr:YheC/YheD family protein [Cohnella sp. YIM B05605]
MPIQRVVSKWAKTSVLMADPRLRQYVPVTQPFNQATLEDMLDRYGMVYVKPVKGTFGKGVIRVEKRPGKRSPYGFQSGVHKYRCSSFEELFQTLSRVKKRKNYLVQQGIELLKYDRRRFDVRIMVQLSPESEWETTGLIGRLAHPRKIVTNYHSGGTLMPVEKLLGVHLDGRKLNDCLTRLKDLGTSVAEALHAQYPGLKEIGIDVAVDDRFVPWILEVNTKPDPYIFRKLPDKSVFRKVYRYAALYGRFRKRKSRIRTA